MADDNADAAGLLAPGGGGARPVAGDDTDAAELFAAGGGGARPVADDNAEGPVAGGGARPVAGAADEDASVGPITEGARPVADASAVGPVAKFASADNAAQDSQTGQTPPLQGRIAGTTRSRMVA